MTSIVTVKMRTCSKTAKITAEMQSDGDTISIRIATDCEHLREYAKRMPQVTMADIVSFEGSAIENTKVRESVSPCCLVPAAVFNAAWMEAGMLSKHLAEDMAKENSVIFGPNMKHDDGSQ
jgi:hypothetical protein